VVYEHRRVGRPIVRGERAPDFVLPSSTGALTRFYGVAGGKITALIFSEPNPDVDELVRLHDDLRSGIDEEIAIVLVLRSPAGSERIEGADIVLVDPDGGVSSIFAAPPKSRLAVLLDPNLRAIDSTSGDASLRAVLANVRAHQPRTAPVEISMNAPVLMIPRALDGSICEELIAMFEELGGEATGIERSHEGTKKVVLDPDFKVRRDITVAGKRIEELAACIGRRVMPEVSKAFAFKATCFEGFKIARYDGADRGHFRAHRDNLSPSTAHRRFALTLNLNEGYEGGHLRFPEYGPHLYRPNAGGAIVFSCSLLHEAMPVTTGTRYVLLSFLFDDHAAQTRSRRGTP
jgi:predicted 2-oxoglutarate/Fe(II)-dependent dioxygenase YbiX